MSAQLARRRSPFAKVREFARQSGHRFSMIGISLLTITFGSLPAVANRASPLISAVELDQAIAGDVPPIILDVRGVLAGSPTPETLFESGHVPGSYHTPYPGVWRTSRNGVSGVVPSKDTLRQVLDGLGIDGARKVVVVPAGTDATEFGAAARVYWTLKYAGLTDIAILDGGYTAWQDLEGARIATGPADAPEPILSGLEFADELLISTAHTADLASVLAKGEENGVTPAAVLLDARPTAQFEGEKKHKAALRFGRIPGATHLDQSRFFDAPNHRLKPREELESIARDLLPDRRARIVSYCNTGHWAATNWFVLREVLGYEQVELYDESMLGWTRNASLPVAGGKSRLDEIVEFFRGLVH